MLLAVDMNEDLRIAVAYEGELRLTVFGVGRHAGDFLQRDLPFLDQGKGGAFNGQTLSFLPENGDEDDEQPQGSPKSSSAGEYLTNFSSAKPELFFNGDLRVRASLK